MMVQIKRVRLTKDEQREGETAGEWIARCGSETVERILRAEREKYGVSSVAPKASPEEIIWRGGERWIVNDAKTGYVRLLDLAPKQERRWMKENETEVKAHAVVASPEHDNYEKAEADLILAQDRQQTLLNDKMELQCRYDHLNAELRMIDEALARRPALERMTGRSRYARVSFICESQ